MLAEGQLWTHDQWENGFQWLDRSLAVFDLIKPPPLFGEKDLRYCHARVLATPQHLFPESPPHTLFLPSLSGQNFKGWGRGDTVDGGRYYLSLCSWCKESLPASLPPTGSGALPSAKRTVRGPTLPVYSLEPLLPEAGQVGVGTR